jgi:tetratricopeptide (TPR) repeat protein
MKYASQPEELLMGMMNEEQTIAHAASLADRGQWKEAISLLKSLEQVKPLSWETLSKLAYYYSKDGAYDDAINLYKNLSERRPSEGKWFYYLGFQYQQKETWAEAIASYQKCLDLAPRWLLPALRLGDTYQGMGELDKVLEAYRKGISSYTELPPKWHNEINKSAYIKLCNKTARLLLDKETRTQKELEETIKLCQESVTHEPNEADNWYRLGCALLEANRVDEALGHLQKAEALNSKKEYICHKIAQVYLKKGDQDQALKAYERVPHHKRVPYILHGMAQCYMAKGENMEAARKFYQSIQREPQKFYHYWDFALALISLGAKDQAIEALEKANKLFQEEHGKDYRKAVEKLEEIKSILPPGNRISFDEPSKDVGVIRVGTITKYNTNRGFGFIKDNSGGSEVFFHITRVKGRVVPQIGTRARFVCEVTEKGLQAAKVWLLGEK